LVNADELERVLAKFPKVEGEVFTLSCISLLVVYMVVSSLRYIPVSAEERCIDMAIASHSTIFQIHLND
jgi:hypothetical protein